MIVGTEWLIDAEGCNAEKLRDAETLQEVFARVMEDLNLKPVGEAHWHKFPAEFGVTGLIMLSESHLACHTYPEFQSATFNLYCCKERPAWNWKENLRKLLEAKSVTIRKIERGSVHRFLGVDSLDSADGVDGVVVINDPTFTVVSKNETAENAANVMNAKNTSGGNR